MAALFIYSVKVSLCMIVFYFAYKMLLSRETFHRFNRIAILSMLVLSMLLPLVRLSSSAENGLSRGLVAMEHAVYVSAEVVSADSGLSLVQWGFVVYSLGVVFFFIRETLSLIRLKKKMGGGSNITATTKVRIIVVDEDIAPFSWFGNIVIGAKDYAENRNEIIIHEMEHVRLRHSWDVLFCNISIIILWFNPAVWLLKQELQNIHEYEADEAVLRKGIDARHYQMLLIRKSVGERLFSMANNLNHNSLKKRITMMKKTRTNPWQRTKALAVLPIAAVAIVAFANPTVEQVVNKVETESEKIVEMVSGNAVAPASNMSLTDAADVNNTDKTPSSVENCDSISEDTCWSLPEVMPEFPGGQIELMKFLSQNIKYPETAVKNNIQGRVMVEFVIDKEGNVISPSVLRGISPELDAEALRIIDMMPKWIPGKLNGKPVKVKYTIPISFVLSNNVTDIKEKQVSTIAGELTKQVLTGSDVGVLLNGRSATNEDLEKISSKKIKEMKVIKDPEQVAKMGFKGKNVVVFITTN